MSGIVGIANFNSEGLNKNSPNHLAEFLAHFGPDGRGRSVNEKKFRYVTNKARVCAYTPIRDPVVVAPNRIDV